MNNISQQYRSNKCSAFILLLTVLIISVVLAISLSIYTLSIKEVILASFLRNSEKAFIASDRALECALYWERSHPQNGLPYTAFATSSAWVEPANYSDIVQCDGQTPSDMSFARVVTSTTGRTTFTIPFSDGVCADVVVYRENEQTTVTSNGYNDCNTLNPRRTQRTIQVTTNI